MREFAFRVVYEAGADDLMDVFIDNPELSSRTVSCHVTPNTMWRVDRVEGPEAALAEYDEAVAQLSRCSSLRGMGGCEIDWTHEVLDSYPTGRVVYSRQSEGQGCRSIPYLVAHYLGDGLLLQAEQQGHEYLWRVLADDGAVMSDIYEELERNLREGLSLEFEHVEHSPNWADHWTTATSDLSDEQHEALALAVAYGYYEHPRRHTLQEIAAEADIPTSTLQYRLSSAEGHLARAFLERAGTPSGLRTPPEASQASR